jgi:hypothetical protein
MITTPPTPLQSCRQMLAQVDAAAGDRVALSAAYVAIVGYDPFEDDPQASQGDVQDTLRDVVREVAASFGVYWSEVDPLEGAPEPAGWRQDC